MTNTKDFDWEKKLRPYIKPFLAAENLLLSMNIKTARVASWTLNADDIRQADRQQLLKAVEEMRRNPQRDTDNLTPPILRIALEQLDEQDNAYNEALDQVIELLRQKII